MYQKNMLKIIGLSILLSSCATTKKSISLGIATGAASGALMGSTMNSDHGKGAMTGLAIGALVGGIAAYFIDDGLEKRDQETRRDTLFNLEKNGVFGSGSIQSSQAPSNFPYGLSSPVVDEQFMDTHVEDGTKLIEGHRIWTIEEGSRWNPQTPNRKSK